MKRILLAVMLSIGVWGFAQNIEKIIKEQIVDKIKGYKPTDLVPYSKDGKKWALMDVKSRKIFRLYDKTNNAGNDFGALQGIKRC